jgi:hypothetical protein
VAIKAEGGGFSGDPIAREPELLYTTGYTANARDWIGKRPALHKPPVGRRRFLLLIALTENEHHLTLEIGVNYPEIVFCFLSSGGLLHVSRKIINHQ